MLNHLMECDILSLNIQPIRNNNGTLWNPNNNVTVLLYSKLVQLFRGLNIMMDILNILNELKHKNKGI